MWQTKPVEYIKRTDYVGVVLLNDPKLWKNKIKAARYLSLQNEEVSCLIVLTQM